MHHNVITVLQATFQLAVYKVVLRVKLGRGVRVVQHYALIVHLVLTLS